MGLFNEEESKDHFGFLGTKPNPPNTHAAEGLPGGYSVGNDVTAQQKARSEDFTDQPGLNPIKRHSTTPSGGREKGYLSDKLDEQPRVYESRTSPTPNSQTTSKVSLNIPTRQQDPYGKSGTLDRKREVETRYDQTKFTGPSPHTLDFGKAKQDMDSYKTNYDSALARLGINRETAMLNDTKPQSVLAAIAGGNTNLLSELATTPPKKTEGMSDEEFEREKSRVEREQKYFENLGDKYEKKYDHHRHHLNKKKIPNYSVDDQSLRVDGYNTKTVTNNNIRSEASFRHEDLIPMYFHDLVNKKFIPFRSFINSVSEGSNATWTDVSYIGRADKVYVYTGFTRTLTLDFTVQAFSLEELHPMWQRINYLVGLTMPASYTKDATQDPNGTSSFIVPPFVKFRLGDMYRNQPVVITDVSTTIPTEASWELFSNEHGAENNYNYLNETIKRDNTRSAQYPTMVTMSVSMTLLEKKAPQTVARHFGDSPADSPHASEDNSIPKGSFNHQLIHYEENATEETSDITATEVAAGT